MAENENSSSFVSSRNFPVNEPPPIYIENEEFFNENSRELNKSSFEETNQRSQIQNQFSSEQSRSGTNQKTVFREKPPSYIRQTENFYSDAPSTTNENIFRYGRERSTEFDGQNRNYPNDERIDQDFYEENRSSIPFDLDSQDCRIEKPKKSLSTRFSKAVRRLIPINSLRKRSSINEENENIERFYGSAAIRNFETENFALSSEEKNFSNRYQNPSSMRIIELQPRKETQPTDVAILKETNHIFVCDVGRSLIEIFDFQGRLEHVIENRSMQQFLPTSLAVAFDGTIVTSSFFSHSLLMYLQTDEAHRHFERNSTLIYDYKPYQLGSEGQQIHQFFRPGGIALDPENSFLFVCDRGNFRIKILTPRGVCERTIELVDEFSRSIEPIAVTCQSTTGMLVILLADNSICFVPKTSTGKIVVERIFIVDEKGVGLQSPTGIASDEKGRLYIADTENHRIVICKPSANFITSFSSRGTSIGFLNRPCSLDLTKDGTIVVADSANRRIHLFGIQQQNFTNDFNVDNELVVAL